MSSIHVLQPHIANQIAAGEVVERPASVVKELVENAIDAGSTSVTVEIENGGMRSIRITDNGSGIAKDDCRNAFLRHATSKIASVEDLDRLNTLGFRGEALASIASVARVTMLTRTRDAETGVKLVIDNGSILSEEDAACIYGTAFTVEALFASVPARLKFLKSARTESGYIGDYMARIILARPDIAFRYVSDGKTVYETYGDGDLFNALYCVYGKTISEKVVPVSFDDGYLKVEGYLGLPQISRTNRTYQTLLLNGRYIRSFSIAASVLSAFDTRIMIGKFPFFVLSLTMAPMEFDVNVHPTKLEVRFADEQRVCGAVRIACRKALTDSAQYVESALDVYLPKDARPYETGDVSVPQTPAGSASSYTPASWSGTGASSFSFERKETPVPNMNTFPKSAGDSGSVYSVPTYRVPKYDPPMDPEPRLYEQTLTPGIAFRIIGCAFNGYWIVEQSDHLYLIDQHAAHERALFDQLSSRQITIAAQPLLVPFETKLTPSEADILETYQKEVQELGYGMEGIGSLSLSITSVPVLNGIQLKEDYLHEVLAVFAEYGKKSVDQMVKEKLMQTACKHAIKAGEPMQREEIQELLASYINGEAPLTCPHGRPVIIRISKTELEKMFRRIL